MIHEIAERIDEVIGRWPESYACDRVEEIQGGFEWTDFYRSDTDQTYSLTPAQTSCMDNRANDCWEMFCDENEIDPKKTWNDLNEEQAEKYAEYESEWFEPALLRLSVQDDHVFLSINYTDQPYYRYQYDEPILKVECAETVDETIKRMSKAFDEYVRSEAA